MAKSSSSTYTVSGRITDLQGKGLAGLNVFAFDSDPNTPDNQLGLPVVTNAQGAYRIEYSDADFRLGGKESGGADLIVRVYADKRLLGESNMRKNAGKKSTVTMQLDYPPKVLAQVSGIVSDYRNEGVGKVEVEAWHKGIKGDVLLGRALTNRSGRYQISYQMQVPATHLFIQAKETKSEIRYAVSEKAELNLQLDKEVHTPLSDWQSLDEKITSKLGVKTLLEVSEDRLEHVAKVSGLEFSELKTGRQAAVFSQNSNLSAKVYYGWLKSFGEVKSAEELLLRYPAQELIGVIRKAKANNAIVLDDDEIKQIEDILVQEKIRTQGNARVIETEQLTYGTLFSTAVPNNLTIQSKVLEDLSNYTGAKSNFWAKTIESAPETEKPDLKRLEFAWELANISLGEESMVNHLINHSVLDGNPLALHRFATWDKQDWISEIQNGRIKIPNTIEGESDALKIERYAEQLTGQAASRYAGVYFAGQMRRDTDNDSPFNALKFDFERFLDVNPWFVPGVGSLEEARSKFVYAGVNEVLIENYLPALHRLTKVSDNYSVVKALYKDGVLSSTGLVGQYGSKAGFVDKYAQLLGGGDQGKKQAAAAYDKAQSNQSAAMEMALRLLPGFIINTTVTPKLQFIDGAAVSTRGPISSLPNREEPNPSVRVPAELATLFGAMETCECEHCESVYSPSAYFLDIMQFLRAASPEAYAELKRRRPDLEYIELNCENALTPLPYIDLVNEILEWKTVSVEPHIQFQTTGEAAALAVQPEHIDTTAYDFLRSQIYPFTLPFDAYLEAMRVYLKHLGVERAELLDLLGETEIAIALEILGLSHRAAAIIVGKDMLSKDPWSDLIDDIINVSDERLPVYYGSSAGYPKFVDDLALEEIDKSDPVRGSVQFFINVVDITYLELLALLNCRFIQELPDNQAGRISIVARENTPPDPNPDPDTCKLNELYLQGLSVPHLHRIHRFLRLWRHLGCSMYELDQLLLTVNSRDLRSEQDLIQFGDAYRIWKKSDLPLEQLRVLWTGLDTYRYKDHQKAGQPDLPSVHEKIFLDKSLFRKILKDSADVSEKMLKDFANVTGKIRMDGENRYLDIIAAAMQSSEQSIKEMVLQIWPGTVDVDLNLANLSKIYQRAFLCKWMGVSPTQLEQLQQICQCDDPFASPRQTQLFLDRVSLIRASGLEMDELVYLLLPRAPRNDEMVVYKDIAKGLQKALGEIWPSTGLQNETISQALNSVVWNYFSGIFNTSQEVLKLILPAISYSIDNSEETGIPGSIIQISKIPVFTERAFIDRDIDLDNDSGMEWMIKYQEVEKFSFWTEKLKLNAQDLAWLMEFNVRFEELWSVRSLEEGAPDFELIETWLKLSDSRKYIKGSPKWYEVMNALELATENLIGLLSSATGWAADTLEQWSQIFGFQAFNSEARHKVIPEYLRRLEMGMALSKKTGISPSDIGNTAKPDKENVQRLKLAIRSKYTEAQWLKVARPLEDTLREQRRDALLAHLIYRNAEGDQWSTANELYEYLLIDVEMSACMMTSRIKQAISSVQLFINRLLMNLEYSENDQRLQLGTEQAQEWNKWRKWYRIWEANRKIFLYPENWIEPELRDDKTSIFKECEDKLSQNELTDELAEETVKHYLEQLDKVARLEIITLFHEKDNPDYAGGVLHVFGRTYAMPHEYYYRRCLMNTSIPGDWRWIAWEKVELDIQGDALTADVWKGRLFLFWPIFSVKSEEEPITMVAPGDTMATSKKYLEVKLAWSERKNNSWESKKMSKDHISISALKIVRSNLPDETYIDSEELLDRLKSVISFSVANSIKIKPFVFHQPDLDIYYYLSDEQIGYFLPNTTLTNFTLKRDLINSSELIDFSNHFEMKGSLWIQNIPSGFFDVKNSLPNHVYDPEYSKQFKIISAPNGLLSLATPTNRPLDEPFFIQDDKNTFFIPESIVKLANPEWLNFPGVTYIIAPNKQIKDAYSFYQHFHHLTKEYQLLPFSELYNRKNQQKPDTIKFSEYQPNPDKVAMPYPVSRVEFEENGGYSLYNWELFFHLPILIACRLSTDQKFEEARKWFHYVFDPSTAEQGGKERFWQFLPFFEEAKMRSRNLQEYINDVNGQIAEWERNPFNPHAIARLRTVAYMKFVVMRYIDNLIEWGDALFRRDTIESINEATHLYIQATKILGPKPELVPQRATPEIATVGSSAANNSTWNIQVAIEAFISPNAAPAFSGDALNMYNFCIPKNDQLLAYWDRVADRLFKIRHCMNIEGIVRQLPLFEPPIDPALLVRAAAAGISINEVLNDLDGTNPPLYRFNFTLQKAKELCGEVKALGSALLSAMEKKDGETLSLLRSRHEMKMTELVRLVKDKQVAEAISNLEGALKSKEIVIARKIHYDGLKFMIKEELDQLGLLDDNIINQSIAHGFESAANFMFALPDFKIGAPTSAGITYGGTNIGNASKAMASHFGFIASIKNIEAQRASAMGSFKRREEDWTLQRTLISKELEQIEKQILAAEIRLAIAQKELSNHEQQIEHTREIDDFLKGKFTNQELYQKMVNQLSTLFFQTYNIAFDLARKAEKCFEHEIGIKPEIIKYDHRSGLKQGLLAGEKLAFDLNRLDVVYLEQNTRDLELTKHISLNQLNPFALLELREKGTCNFAIPEELFDLDFPGHYMRRIKSVSITIPCVAGPYTTINAVLRLKKEGRRLRDNKDYQTPIVLNNAMIQSIATSSAQNDSGLFELNFRDERYLPFEGAGAISEWTLEMMETKELRQFDYHTIADVVVHLRYTAREDGGLKTAAVTHLKGLTNALGGVSLQRLFSLRHDFPNEWHRHAQRTTQQEGQEEGLVIQLAKHHFPYWVQMGDVTITGFELHKNGVESSAGATGGTISDSAVVALSLPLSSSELKEKELRDVWLVVNYSKAVIASN